MKLYKYLVAFFVVAGLSSCNDLLDMSPEDTLSPDTYFANATQLQLWTNGFYTDLESADNCASSNADDNIDTELGETLMGQRSAASEEELELGETS